MAKTKWLDRAVFLSPVYYCLCTTEKEYKRVLKRLDIDYPIEWLKNEWSGACTHFATNDKGQVCAVVCMPINMKRTLVEMHAMLVHEATHISQEIMSHIGEKHPSSEFQAYVIQKISLELIGEFMRKLHKVPKKLAKIMEHQAKIYA